MVLLPFNSPLAKGYAEGFLISPGADGAEKLLPLKKSHWLLCQGCGCSWVFAGLPKIIGNSPASASAIVFSSLWQELWDVLRCVSLEEVANVKVDCVGPAGALPIHVFFRRQNDQPHPGFPNLSDCASVLTIYAPVAVRSGPSWRLFGCWEGYHKVFPVRSM